MPQLETTRLYMIPFTLELVEATIQGTDKLEKRIPYKVSKEWPMPDYAEILPFKAERLRGNPESSIWSGIIIHKRDNLVIGDMGFKGGPNDTGTVEIGYSIVPSYQGNGYATEMAEAMISWGLSQPNVNRVTAECLENNVASARVLEKNGLKEIKRENGMIYWSKEKE
jgi:ribosomal-protein-alanine N-acetyltransferase